ncbi:unnamed protein product [Clonostachys byssicola]|uniref:2,4-dienoyl-CoA reductase [(3E)-enoyl-CoA-producing] n=1 Tax=Clonostachys byssicola TaxID=160290 RepID=A0A9N9XZD9_9HYPO|nr:unnamed protein product [Clonostachys byssicola]
MNISKQDYVSSVWRDGIFDDRVVFCTGGAGTIGSAQVRALVHLGANACIVGRNIEKTQQMAVEIETACPGSKVLGIGGVDVRNLQSLEKAVDRCVDELGGIDYVIAGAAGNFLAPISGLSSNAFQTVVNIDLVGSFNTFKATADYLVESTSKNPNPSSATGGRIVFMSTTFHYAGMPFQAHVSSAKAGVDALSASIALEYGPRGINSNVISPGGIGNTEGLERLSSKATRDTGEAGSGVPLGRYGLVREISDATVYLFAETGNYVNGHVLVVDGGAWRMPELVGGGGGMKYPDIVLRDFKLAADIKTGRETPKPKI